MTMLAQQVVIGRVENGWIVAAQHAASSVTMVAKTIDEVCGFLKGMDWNSPRPLPDAPGGGYARGEMVSGTPR